MDPQPSPTALAQLAEDVGHALLRFADTLRQEEPTPADAGRRLGKTQARVMQLGGLTDAAGMSGGEVAKELGLAQGNAQRTLTSLTTLGLLEQVEDVRPQRWRTLS